MRPAYPLRQSCEHALEAAWRRARPGAPWRRGIAGYLRSSEDNLLDGIDPAPVRDAYRRGAGNEWTDRDGIPAKFCAAHSSSALVANSFVPFARYPGDFEAFGLSGFGEPELEAICPTGLRGTPPHLDVLLRGDSHVLAIESKCTEYLAEKVATFSPAYDTLRGSRFEPAWEGVYDALLRDPRRFSPLDAGQLVKHYLGLRNSCGACGLTLAYLYWEPRNANAEIFWRHRDALTRFSESVADSSVRFVSASYLDLWRAWQRRGIPWLDLHVEGLLARYHVEV